jgi:hypothetical protein
MSWSRASGPANLSWRIRHGDASHFELQWSEWTRCCGSAGISAIRVVADLCVCTIVVAVLLLLLLACRGGEGRRRGARCWAELEAAEVVIPFWYSGAVPSGRHRDPD